jgi:hypothetical protein
MALFAVLKYAHLAADSLQQATPMKPRLAITRRRVLLDTIAGAGALSVLSTAHATCSARTPSGVALPTGDIHDFDFFVGEWNSTNRRLRKRWVGSDDWEVFPNTVRCESRMNGIVSLDEVDFTTKGWRGMTVRTFSFAKRQWSLYWVNSLTGELFPPVVGGFSGDYGEFYGDDTDEGRPIKVLFPWTRLGRDAAHWEQAFSLDGKQWETNWLVDHKRVKS